MCITTNTAQNFTVSCCTTNVCNHSAELRSPRVCATHERLQGFAQELTHLYLKNQILTNFHEQYTDTWWICWYAGFYSTCLRTKFPSLNFCVRYCSTNVRSHLIDWVLYVSNIAEHFSRFSGYTKHILQQKLCRINTPNISQNLQCYVFYTF